MSIYNESGWEDVLKAEGFGEICVWHNSPDEIYPQHEHAGDTAHVVLQGSMVIRINGEEHEYVVGDRFDIPAHVAHSVRMGSEGCTYIIGEKV